MNSLSFSASILGYSFFTFCISFTLSLNADGLSLLALKAAVTKDPTQALISWSDSDLTPCRWEGITCGKSHQRVASISLSNKNLSGYIPSEIGTLSLLTLLDLSQNNFSGPLPFSIASLQSLIHLDVSCNGFNGSLPERLSNLTNLRGTLNLSYNAFSGEVPDSFGRFSVMVSLDLRHNNLTGKIPQVGTLLNQGPTAFAGNPYLCGFPLSTPCTVPEAQNPRFLKNPQEPGNMVLSSGLGEKRGTKSGSVTVSVISGVFVVIGVVFVAVWVIKKSKWKREETRLGKENVSKGVVGMGSEEGKRGKFVVLDEGFGLELEDLLRASAYVVGKSRSGIVYKVVVGGGGTTVGRCGQAVVAVRRLSEGDVKWRFKDFEAEVEAVGKVQHPNIVRLRAYYFANDEKLLVSDFIRNGSLHAALHGGPGNTVSSLSWAARLRIAQEVATALVHIHECSPRKYAHGDIKSSKVLLDESLKPYVAGFGLSRLVPNVSRTSRKQDIAGSKSSAASNAMHLAPEARGAATRVTQKCDVYSYGILLLEMLTGRLPDGGSDGKGLEGLVRKVFGDQRPLSEIIDPNLIHEVQAKKQVLGMFHIALKCTEIDPELRPKMRAVSDNLDRLKLE